jgi:hypothetical protein
MPRVALPDSLQPCRISGCLYTPYVQDQRIFGSIIDQPRTSQLQLDVIDDLSNKCVFQDLAGYPQILDELRPLRGRHAYKGSLRSALRDSLQLCSKIWVSLYFA